jgi:hypothetical protein
MSSIVDIHPHVISTDTKRYPLNPLGAFNRVGRGAADAI